MSLPLFTVVIPTYNRPRETVRAVQSCLNQNFDSFEIVVVDDGSSDGTVEQLRAIRNPRLHVITHESNRGVQAARATGVRSASGEWIIFLDSDDELLSGALLNMSGRVQTVEENIGRICFTHLLDTGGTTPQPPLHGQILDYEGYVQWADRACPSDQCSCIRRRTFALVPFPPERIYERLYCLNFARAFRSWMLPDIAGIVHSDAANRESNLSIAARVAKTIREAPDEKIGVDRILADHGDALRLHGPRTWRTLLRRQAQLSFLLGNRRTALRYLLRGGFSTGSSIRCWCVAVLGMAGPLPLALTTACYRKARP